MDYADYVIRKYEKDLSVDHQDVIGDSLLLSKPYQAYMTKANALKAAMVAALAVVAYFYGKQALNLILQHSIIAFIIAFIGVMIAQFFSDEEQAEEQKQPLIFHEDFMSQTHSANLHNDDSAEFRYGSYNSSTDEWERHFD